MIKRRKRREEKRRSRGVLESNKLKERGMNSAVNDNESVKIKSINRYSRDRLVFDFFLYVSLSLPLSISLSLSNSVLFVSLSLS